MIRWADRMRALTVEICQGITGPYLRYCLEMPVVTAVHTHNTFNQFLVCFFRLYYCETAAGSAVLLFKMTVAAWPVLKLMNQGAGSNLELSQDRSGCIVMDCTTRLQRGVFEFKLSGVT